MATLRGRKPYIVPHSSLWLLWLWHKSNPSGPSGPDPIAACNQPIVALRPELVRLMRKLDRAALASELRIGKKQLERLIAAGKIPPPDGRTYPGGSYWQLTTRLKAIIAAQRRPER